MTKVKSEEQKDEGIEETKEGRKSKIARGGGEDD